MFPWGISWIQGRDFSCRSVSGPTRWPPIRCTRRLVDNEVEEVRHRSARHKPGEPKKGILAGRAVLYVYVRREVPASRYERRRVERGTRGALSSKESWVVTSENPKISNLGNTKRSSNSLYSTLVLWHLCDCHLRIPTKQPLIMVCARSRRCLVPCQRPRVVLMSWVDGCATKGGRVSSPWTPNTPYIPR